MNPSSCHIFHLCSTQLVGRVPVTSLLPILRFHAPCILRIPAPPSIKNCFKTRCNRRHCSLCLLDGSLVYTPRLVWIRARSETQ